jgi:CBS domain containing-hemolysin-like protein
MKGVHVKEVMVPLAEYATVDENATMAEAVQALESARSRFGSEKLKHRAILVTGPGKKVVGRISYLDFLQGLEPKYSEIEELYRTINRELGSRYHLAADYTPDLMSSQIRQYSLWEKPLSNLCEKAANCLAREFMHVPVEADFIDGDATLDQAIHQFVLVRSQSLLVRKDGGIVGILRLSDVVETLFGMVRQCALKAADS